MPVYTIGQLAERLGATLRGAEDQPISGLATLQEAQPEQLSFLANAQPQVSLRLSGGCGAVNCTPTKLCR